MATVLVATLGCAGIVSCYQQTSGAGLLSWAQECVQVVQPLKRREIRRGTSFCELLSTDENGSNVGIVYWYIPGDF